MTTLTQPVMGSRPFLPRSPEYLRDPHSELQEMRSQGSCYVDPGSNQWFLLGYDEVDAGLSLLPRDRTQGPGNVHFPDNPFSADGPAVHPYLGDTN